MKAIWFLSSYCGDAVRNCRVARSNSPNAVEVNSTRWTLIRAWFSKSFWMILDWTLFSRKLLLTPHNTTKILKYPSLLPRPPLALLLRKVYSINIFQKMCYKIYFAEILFRKFYFWYSVSKNFVAYSWNFGNPLPKLIIQKWFLQCKMFFFLKN